MFVYPSGVLRRKNTLFGFDSRFYILKRIVIKLLYGGMPRRSLFCLFTAKCLNGVFFRGNTRGDHPCDQREDHADQDQSDRAARRQMRLRLKWLSVYWDTSGSCCRRRPQAPRLWCCARARRGSKRRLRYPPPLPRRRSA